MSAAEEAEELVEAALGRIEFRRRAQVRFADHARGIAGRPQAIGKSRFRKRQADRVGARAPRLAARTGIELVPEALLIAPVNSPARVGLQ